MKKEERDIIALIVLWNIAAIVCFTILSVVFNKWWIVLFSALFYKGWNYKGGNKNGKD